MKARYEDGLSISQLQDYLADFGKDEILSISADQILGFEQIILEAIGKITATGHYQEFEEKVRSRCADQEILAVFIEFASYFECCKTHPSIRGPCGLGYDFYWRF